ncbi:MAG: NAD-dependent epimerase/dehydratase family protein [Candidatus Aminicenantia bacterium]
MVNFRVFVTGGTGFIGAHLVNELIKEGFNVKILVRDKEKAKRLFGENVEYVEGDILNESLVWEAVKGTDLVFHLASVINVGNIPENYYHNVNVKGTENLLKASFKEGVKKFIFASSVNVYAPYSEEILNEESPCKPDEILGKTKLEAEKLLNKYFEEKGLHFVILRISRVYGPGDFSLFKLFKQISSGFFLMIGKGKGLIQPVFVKDVVDALILSAKREDLSNETFIIAGEEILTKREFCEEVAVAMGKRISSIYVPIPLALPFIHVIEKASLLLGKDPFLSKRRARFFLTSQRFSIEKANRVLGFKPKVKIKEGIKITAEWYRENNQLIY